MSDKQFSILYQYVVAQKLATPVRPYTLRSGVSQQIQLQLKSEKLPEDSYWRTELTVKVMAFQGETLCCEAESTLEAITVINGFELDEVKELLAYQVAGALFASARQLISSLTIQTGYGPWTLPALNADVLASQMQFQLDELTFSGEPSEGADQ